MDWPEPMPAIGRLANFSSLRKGRPKDYGIYDSYFGRLNPSLVIELNKDLPRSLGSAALWSN